MLGIEPCTLDVCPGTKDDALEIVSQYTTFPSFADTTTIPGSPLADFDVKVASGSGSSRSALGNGSLKVVTSRDEGVDALEL